MLLGLRRCAAMKPSRIARAAARCGEDSGNSSATCDGNAVERCAANSSASSPAAAGCVVYVWRHASNERRRSAPALVASGASASQPSTTVSPVAAAGVAAGFARNPSQIIRWLARIEGASASQTSRSTSARTASTGRPTANNAWPRTAAASRCACSGSDCGSAASKSSAACGRPSANSSRASSTVLVCCCAAVAPLRASPTRRRASAVSP